VVYAIVIGPIVHVTIPWLALPERPRFAPVCPETTTT
jgi:hypothetical protein